MSLPSTVTVVDPVPGTLLSCELLGAAASIVIDAVKLLMPAPAVNTTRRSVQIPRADRAISALSDAHRVTSLAVPASRALIE
jgi:hypothetical protein